MTMPRRAIHSLLQTLCIRMDAVYLYPTMAVGESRHDEPVGRKTVLCEERCANLNGRLSLSRLPHSCPLSACSTPTYLPLFCRWGSRYSSHPGGGEVSGRLTCSVTTSGTLLLARIPPISGNLNSRRHITPRLPGRSIAVRTRGSCDGGNRSGWKSFR